MLTVIRRTYCTAHCETNVLRAVVVLSIAVILGLGPAAATPCAGPCNDRTPFADTCHRSTAVSTHITATDTCAERPASVATLARDETPRDRSCGPLTGDALPLRDRRHGAARQTASPELLLTRTIPSFTLRI